MFSDVLSFHLSIQIPSWVIIHPIATFTARLCKLSACEWPLSFIDVDDLSSLVIMEVWLRISGCPQGEYMHLKGDTKIFKDLCIGF